jgi:ATP-dependent RNA helicase DHX36
MCIALYSSYDATTFLPEVSVPAMKRVPLTELCLLIKQLPPLSGAGDGDVDAPTTTTTENLCAQVFSLALDSPDPNAVEAALFELRRLGALDRSERLTPLGRMIARLPIDPRMSKMLVLGSLLGCAEQAATLAACLQRDPFVVAALPQRGEALRARLSFVRRHLGGRGEFLTEFGRCYYYFLHTFDTDYLF